MEYMLLGDAHVIIEISFTLSPILVKRQTLSSVYFRSTRLCSFVSKSGKLLYIAFSSSFHSVNVFLSYPFSIHLICLYTSVPFIFTEQSLIRFFRLFNSSNSVCLIFRAFFVSSSLFVSNSSLSSFISCSFFEI